MKGKIYEHGNLVINGKERLCPYQQGDIACGDWCALFVGPSHRGYQVDLLLCQALWTFNLDDFEDLRPQSSQADSK